MTAAPTLSYGERRHRESGEFASGELRYRAAALEWMQSDGAWTLSEAVEWSMKHLVVTGELTGHRDSEPLSFLWERRAGLLRTDPSYDKFVQPAIHLDCPILRARHFARVHRVAFDRVRAALRGMLDGTNGDRFVNAALYAGRVYRDHGRWRVRLSDAVPMSEQVLALFAADVLRRREDYEQRFAICDTCAAITFDRGGLSRFSCAAHP